LKGICASSWTITKKLSKIQNLVSIKLLVIDYFVLR